MERRRIKWLLLIAWLLAIPFIYTFDIHPLFGFLAAFLSSWLIVEDFYDRMIDLRVSAALLLTVLVWNDMKDAAHLFQAVITFLGFSLAFSIVRMLFAKFVSLKEYAGKHGDAKPDCIDSLQEGANVGLMPLLGLSVFLVLTFGMVFHPMQIVIQMAKDGSASAWVVLQTHLSFLQIGIYLGANRDVLFAILAAMVLLLLALLQYTRRRIGQGMVPLYPCGAGDPLVLGIFAAMMGAECFYLGAMMLTLAFGILYHIYTTYKGRRIG